MMTNLISSRCFLQKTIQFVLLCAVVCVGSNDLAAQNDARVLYDPSNGNAWLEFNSSLITTASLTAQNADGSAQADDVIHTLFVEDSELTPFRTDSESLSQLAYGAGLNSFLPAGTHRLGPVFDPGLSFGTQEVPPNGNNISGEYSPVTISAGPRRVFLNYTVQGVTGRIIAPVTTISSVPEPSSVLMLSIMGLAPAFRRRRK